MLALLAIALVAILSCSSPSGTSPPPPPAVTQTLSPPDGGARQVTIKNFAFAPSTVTVKPGDTVTWVNEDAILHTISGPDWDSGNLTAGKSYSHTFSEAGSFAYICSVHPLMRGAVVVQP